MAALEEAKSVPWTILTGHVLTLHPHDGTAASLGSPPGGQELPGGADLSPRAAPAFPGPPNPTGGCALSCSTLATRRPEHRLLQSTQRSLLASICNLTDRQQAARPLSRGRGTPMAIADKIMGLSGRCAGTDSSDHRVMWCKGQQRSAAGGGCSAAGGYASPDLMSPGAFPCSRLGGRHTASLLAQRRSRAALRGRFAFLFYSSAFFLHCHNGFSPPPQD